MVDGYIYGGLAEDGLTGALNSDYTILRFGPVYHGTTSYAMPMIYAEDGRLSNFREQIAGTSRYYDLLRWMKKDLDASSAYEICWCGQPDMHTSSTGAIVTHKPTDVSRGYEYLTGQLYSGGIGTADYRNPRTDYNNYPTALSAMSVSYPNMVDYAGSAEDIYIRKFRDMHASLPYNGQYLKFRTSEWDTIRNSIIASNLPSSALRVNSTTQVNGMYIITYDSISGSKFEIKDLDFKYLGQHCFDGSKTQSNGSISGAYNVGEVNEGVWWASTWIYKQSVGYRYSMTGVVNGLTGW
jgi:hypothetical protein